MSCDLNIIQIASSGRTCAPLGVNMPHTLFLPLCLMLSLAIQALPTWVTRNNRLEHLEFRISTYC